MKILILGLMSVFSLMALAQDPCAKSCVVSAECGTGGVCNQGLCEYQARFCANERWSANARGETTNCDAYACSKDTGLCLRKAESSNDCLTGYVYDGAGKCVPSVLCNAADPNCADLMDRWQKARSEYEITTPEPQLPALTCLACQQNSDCTSGRMCWKGRCEKVSAYCSVSEQGEHFSNPGARQTVSCGNYTCDPVPGACLSSCLKTSECRSGKQCVAGSCL